MKLSFSLLALLLGAIQAKPHLRFEDDKKFTQEQEYIGLCYNYGAASPTLKEQVDNDMATIASCNATSQVVKIRTYFPSFYGTKVTEFLPGKKLMPGFNPRDAWEWKSQLDDDLRIVYGHEDVEAIIYLNEKFGSDDIEWAGNFIESMRSIRTSKPILTSQTLQWDYGVYKSLLAKGFDGIMINIYPNRAFSGNTMGDPDADFNDFCTHLKTITDYYTASPDTGENFYGVSETGMPANPFGSSVVRGYYERIQQFVSGTRNCPDFSYAKLVDRNGGPSTWLGIYGFEATSEPNKGSALENSFGITDAFCGPQASTACTQSNGDPYSTGSLIECCAGLRQEKFFDGNTWRFHCVSDSEHEEE